MNPFSLREKPAAGRMRADAPNTVEVLLTTLCSSFQLRVTRRGEQDRRFHVLAPDPLLAAVAGRQAIRYA